MEIDCSLESNLHLINRLFNIYTQPILLSQLIAIHKNCREVTYLSIIRSETIPIKIWIICDFRNGRADLEILIIQRNFRARVPSLKFYRLFSFNLTLTISISQVKNAHLKSKNRISELQLEDTGVVLCKVWLDNFSN